MMSSILATLFFALGLGNTNQREGIRIARPIL